MAIGTLGWIGVGKESTPGTPVSAVNVFLPTETFSAVQTHEPVEVAANVASLAKLGYLAGKLTPKGSLTAPLSVDNAELLAWALGNISTVDNGDGTYTHTITPALTLPTFTVHANEVVMNVEQAGAKISKLTLSAAAGEVAKMSVEWLATAHTEGVTLSETPSFPTNFVNFTEAVITLDGSQKLTVENIELTIENNLESLFTLGTARTPQNVARGDRPAYTGKIVLIDWDASLYAKMLAADSVSITVKLTDPAGYYIQIDLPKVQFTGGGFEPSIGTGRITAEPEFAAVGENPITITVLNNKATL